MPVINREHFTLKDAVREVYYNNPAVFQNGVYMENVFLPVGDPMNHYHSLRHINANANPSYFDLNYSGENGLRRYRNYHKEDGIYLYCINLNVFMYNMALEGRTYINEETGSGYPALPKQSYFKYRIMNGGQVYVTLHGFEGWHIPTEKEIDVTFAACGGINDAGFYLKQHPVIINYPPIQEDYWLNSVERCPDYDRDLGLVPGGARNVYSGEWGHIGEIANYLYFKYDTYDTISYSNNNWDSGEGYSSEYANRPIAEVRDTNTYYQGKNEARPIKSHGKTIFSLVNNSNAITKTFLYDSSPSTAVQIRLVRDPDNIATSHVDFNGNVYDTINIGGIVWMKQDVKATQLGYTFAHRDKNLKDAMINTSLGFTTVAYNDNRGGEPIKNVFPQADFNPAASYGVYEANAKSPSFVIPYLDIQNFSTDLQLAKGGWSPISGSSYGYYQRNFGFKIVQPYITHVPL